jgi:hypothetical protein
MTVSTRSSAREWVFLGIDQTAHVSPLKGVGERPPLVLQAVTILSGWRQGLVSVHSHLAASIVILNFSLTPLLGPERRLIGLHRQGRAQLDHTVTALEDLDFRVEDGSHHRAVWDPCRPNLVSHR